MTSSTLAAQIRSLQFHCSILLRKNTVLESENEHPNVSVSCFLNKRAHFVTTKSNVQTRQSRRVLRKVLLRRAMRASPKYSFLNAAHGIVGTEVVTTIPILSCCLLKSYSVSRLVLPFASKKLKIRKYHFLQAHLLSRQIL